MPVPFSLSHSWALLDQSLQAGRERERVWYSLDQSGAPRRLPREKWDYCCNPYCNASVARDSSGGQPRAFFVGELIERSTPSEDFTEKGSCACYRKDAVRRVICCGCLKKDGFRLSCIVVEFLIYFFFSLFISDLTEWLTIGFKIRWVDR